MVKRYEALFFTLGLAIALPIAVVVLYDPIMVFYYDHTPMFRSIGSFIGTAVVIGIITLAVVAFIGAIIANYIGAKASGWASNATSTKGSGGALGGG